MISLRVTKLLMLNLETNLVFNILLYFVLITYTTWKIAPRIKISDMLGEAISRALSFGTVFNRTDELSD